MAIRDKIPMGTLVAFKNVAIVRKGWETKGLAGKEMRRIVRREEHDSGIVCGVRSLQEGHVVYGGPNEATYFEAEAHGDVYLVAISYKQVVRVFPEDSRVVDTEHIVCSEATCEHCDCCPAEEDAQ